MTENIYKDTKCTAGCCQAGTKANIFNQVLTEKYGALKIYCTYHTHNSSLVLTYKVAGISLTKQSKFLISLWFVFFASKFIGFFGLILKISKLHIHNILSSSFSCKQLKILPVYWSVQTQFVVARPQLTWWWKLESVLTVISPDSQVHPAAILALHLIQSEPLLTCRETLPVLHLQRGIRSLNTSARKFMSKVKNLTKL